MPRPWQATATILAAFGPPGARARTAYRAFVGAWVFQGRRPEYQGGGLVRRAGGWTEAMALHRAQEAVAGDARVLGGGEVGDRLWREAASAHSPQHPRLSLETLVRRVCRLAGVTPEEVAGSGRRAAVTRTRDGIAHLCRRTSGTHSTDLVRGPAPCLVGGVHRAVWGALSVEVSCEDLGRELPGPVLMETGR